MLSPAVFPNWADAPRLLRQLDGHCGPLAAWGVLRYFHKRTSAQRLIKECRHTKKYGTFMIALAVALREHGLDVTFYSDPDPSPHLIERRCHRLAQSTGVRMAGAANLDGILSRASARVVPVILYGTDQDDGHISPMLAHTDESVFLPYAEDQDHQVMSKADLLRRWSAPKICRQCLLVSR